MSLFNKVKVGEKIISPIDWEMSPDLCFGTYESWGGRERVRNNAECVYYFFVDNWGDKPKLCLMERAVKHAKVIAEVLAPLVMLEHCVASQGVASRFEQSYPINEEIKDWLLKNVLDGGREDLLIPLVDEEGEGEDMGESLPEFTGLASSEAITELPRESAIIKDDEIEGIIKKWNFYDSNINHSGGFASRLSAFGDDAVVDSATGLMWQRGGLDIASIRTIQRGIAELNERGLAGFHDWRLPSMEEAMSLMEPGKNGKDLFLPLCFSKQQPFIFVAAQRKPGGYWFVDYKQGRAFWSSGTIPGAFARLVRTV
ncbi:Lcl C-terminal domain-containing protein [Desulfotalea psychrophila]|uniref:Lcl C-terminal domain-containing protein n=1 Tax=Desulfotalea psychrophila (strain LSv54 / DSM 12343) TaxID=177439 RepID=Q6AS78_DESPS|nr:DUF1566 domain-containing protein [Desulfotalea psychrophila]CAG34797.1 unknown protein [Desulfotalea psychrophila LSv54]